MKVYRASPWGDWESHCRLHNDTTTCSDWEAAMEAAYGHLAMHHGGPA